MHISVNIYYNNIFLPIHAHHIHNTSNWFIYNSVLMDFVGCFFSFLSFGNLCLEYDYNWQKQANWVDWCTEC